MAGRPGGTLINISLAEGSLIIRGAGAAKRTKRVVAGGPVETASVGSKTLVHVCVAVESLPLGGARAVVS